MPAVLQIFSMTISSFGPGATKRATSVFGGSSKGPRPLPVEVSVSSSTSAASLAANPRALVKTFFPFFFFLEPPPGRRFMARTRHWAPASFFQKFLAKSASSLSTKVHTIFSPPTGWNISTKSRASSRLLRSKVDCVGAPASGSSSTAEACRRLRPPLGLVFFSTPKSVPTGNSMSIRESRFWSAVCVACRQLVTASLTSRGSSSRLLSLFPKEIMRRLVLPLLVGE
mmetsp:Transcript_6013/g.14568  ORF Transcript_6013/g.14568 Transcript_6013/m.14568 type:complete len:227 (+) Transcript_6013:375-1055(+)